MSRGAGKARKVEVEHGPVPTYLRGVENVGHRSNVGVRERVSLCVRALLSLQEGANFRA